MIPPYDPDPPPGMYGAILGAVSGIMGGLFSYGWFNGATRATLQAHDKRITQLEDDIRYEIRALRDTIEARLPHVPRP
jgi:hypothetical protein